MDKAPQKFNLSPSIKNETLTASMFGYGFIYEDLCLFLALSSKESTKFLKKYRPLISIKSKSYKE